MSENAFEQTQTMYRGVTDDRRRYPRIDLQRPAQVMGASGEPHNASVRDLSPDGVQIRCSRAVARELHPSGRSIRPGEVGPNVHVLFALPFGGETAPVKLVGAVVHFALINADLVSIGLKFKKMSLESQKHVKRFIRASLEPC